MPRHLALIAAAALGAFAACATATAQATPAAAAPVPDMTELAKASGCFSCHSVEEKVVGPSYRKVAAKYAGQKDAVTELTMSIQNGSVGKWGRIPMPAHASLPAPDVKRLAEWVLAVK